MRVQEVARERPEGSAVRRAESDWATARPSFQRRHPRFGPVGFLAAVVAFAIYWAIPLAGPWLLLGGAIPLALFPFRGLPRQIAVGLLAAWAGRIFTTGLLHTIEAARSTDTETILTVAVGLIMAVGPILSAIAVIAAPVFLLVRRRARRTTPIEPNGTMEVWRDSTTRP